MNVVFFGPVSKLCFFVAEIHSAGISIIQIFFFLGNKRYPKLTKILKNDFRILCLAFKQPDFKI